MTSRPGVLLMTYGSPATLDRADVAAYLARVRGGRAADPELIDEFTRRYRAIGGSPLPEITAAQAAALERELAWPVRVGMRFGEPSVAAGLEALRAAGATRVVGVILSPQYSPLLMRGYAGAIDAARQVDPSLPSAVVAGAWHTQPAFVHALADRTRAALDAGVASTGRRPHVLMTAHSLPRRVAEQEPDYLAQLEWTARAVADAAGLADDAWTFCWQSAGHEPGEWMKPDFADLMPGIADAGGREVLVVPVQFLADHLETLYDVDIGAREQAEPFGIAFTRLPALNDDPGLIAALAAAARETLEASRPVAEPAATVGAAVRPV
jgi:protoporphyrin/coproporphyrin ferrochelatase